ncbi:MAG: phosphoenolpyruvate--protein phosphotransferase [Pyrinomonadaceae bacterium]
MDNSKTPPAIGAKIQSEITLKARSVSRGVAIGKLVCLHGKKRQFYRINLRDSQVEREIRRLNGALRLAKNQLVKIRAGKSSNVSEATAGIFEVHRMILEDSSLVAAIERVIREDKVNAEWAVKVASDNVISKYKAIHDEHLRDRYIDLEDVAERILTALGGGGGRTRTYLEKDSIIVAKEVKPSTLLELIENEPKAIITEHGGWTSHTFILAREINLPAVTGIRKLLRRVQTGDEVVVDAYAGQIIHHPTESTITRYRAEAARFRESSQGVVEVPRGTLETLDKRKITIRANVDLPVAYRRAKRLGAKGIGLYRSEFLFNQFKGFPTEHEQIAAYRKIAELAGLDGVRIRTFDLTFESFAQESDSKEKNPALGLRAIRLSLLYPKEFRTQIRSLLQASAGTKIDIVLPLISDVSEVIQAKRIIEEEKAQLIRKDIEIGAPSVGAMIETPAAVLTINEIAKEVAFMCLGTNDLVQYLLAVDRDNENVADWFRTLHPAVIRAVKTVIESAELNNTPLIVCGEMAGSPFYAPVLIGLGAKELSMNVNSILRVRNVIAGIAFEEAHVLSKELEQCPSARETEGALYDNLIEKWAHLFPPEEIASIRRNGA